MNNLLRAMQEEFRNSQFINIYFHKFAPSRLFFPWLALVPSPFPPPAPQLLLTLSLPRPLSMSLRAAVTVSVSPSRPP